MSKTVLMFPGQGSQFHRMTEDFTNDRVIRKLSEMNQVLDEDVLSIMQSENDIRLNQTEYTQPAILMHSVALLDNNAAPEYVVGHSLGEYSALVAAGVLSADDAVKIVRKRGQLMSEAFSPGVGSMAAVMGSSKEAIDKACSAISNDEARIEIANINCPGQIVVAGHATAIQKLMAAKSDYHLKKVIPLNVSGPFHSSLMKVIENEFSEFISQFTFKDAMIPVVQNVTGVPETDGKIIQHNLIKQIYSPVQFEASINYLIANGVERFIEIGPGKVLSGLVKKIDREKDIIQINNDEDMKQIDGGIS